ncbi:hypothetical protein MMPV_006201 [Pyropia vietnamensis]
MVGAASPHPARRVVTALFAATVALAAVTLPATLTTAAGFLPVYVDFGGAGTGSAPASPYVSPGAAGLVWAARPTWTWRPEPPRAPITGAADIGVPASVFGTHLSSSVAALTVTVPVVADEGDRQMRVRLLFAEVYSGTFAVGARTFDVAALAGVADAEDEAAWADSSVSWTPVDVFAAVGANAAYAVDLEVEVPSGDASGVHVRLRKGTQNVMLSGLALTLAKPDAGSGHMAVTPTPPPPVVSLAGWTLVEPAAGEPAARHESCFVNYRNRFVQIGGRGARPISIYNPSTRVWTSVWPQGGPGEIHHMQCVTVPAATGDGVRIAVVGAWTGPYPTESTVPHIWYYEPDAGPAGTWTRGAFIPEDVQRGAGGVVVSPDGKLLYLIAGNMGGHGLGSASSSRADMLDLTTGNWTRLPNAPHARDHFHAVLVDDEIVVAGGRNGGVADFWNANLRQVDVFRTTDASWRTLQRGGLDVARGGAVVGSIPGSKRLVLAGGEGGGRVWAPTEVLDMENERWVAAPGGGMVVARHGTQAVACGGGLWVAGGSGAQGGAPELTSMEVWTPDGQGVPEGACVPY